jgi:CRP-like cAMP-binding protein
MADDNLLLAGLSAEDRSRLFGRGGPERLPKGAVLFEAGTSVPYAWFPTSGLIALEFPAPDGSALELVAIGREGFVGAAMAPSEAPAPFSAIVRVAVTAYRFRASQLAAARGKHAALARAIESSASLVLSRVARAAHCRHAHSVLERVCGWLLTADDHLGAAVVDVTQEDLSRMLGTKRRAVARALTELHRADAILSARGRILIRKRARLEATACECYALIACGRVR